MKPHTVAEQMARFGIPESEQGPFCTELRILVQKNLDMGMIYQSAGTWQNTFYHMSFEEQAQCRLAADWACRHSSYRTRMFGPLIYRKTDTKTMKRSICFRWKLLPDWLLDKRDYLIFLIKQLRKKQNPYV